MKKIGMMFVVLLLVSTTVFAQGIVAKGVKAGMNITNLKGDDVEDMDAKIGFTFGGFVTYQINESFSLQPELLFTMKGAKSEYSDYEEEEDYEYYEKYEDTYSLNYLEIPVLAKMAIPMSGNVQPCVFIGPSLGINLSAKYDEDYSYKEYEDGELIYSESGSEDGDIDDNESIDFGLNFGAGVKYNNITFDARYNLGLSDVIKDVKAQNSVFSFMLGYCF